jgi:DNA-binding NarL/FixJ family response regulator
MVNENSAPDPADEVRVLVVDDQAPFRVAVRAVIDRAPGFRLVGEAGDGAEALQQVADLDPDLVLMDIKMPVLDGIETTARLVADGHRPVVFLLSTYDRTDLPDGVTASGAAAYLHKEELSPQVLAELWAAHRTR